MAPPRSKRADLEGLAWEIAHCSHFEGYDEGRAGVCSGVIQAQGRWRRPPEGWTGNLLQAPILFVTSNPNTDVTKPGTDPTFASGVELSAFNDAYFDSHGVGGARTWQQMQRWASMLMSSREAIAGKDWALTDAVRCASPGQLGVDRAMGRCASLYLGRVLSLSPAKVIGFCGTARLALRDFIEPARYRMNLAEREVRGPIEFFERDRYLIGLRHPADIYHGGLELTSLSADDLRSMISALKS